MQQMRFQVLRQSADLVLHDVALGASFGEGGGGLDVVVASVELNRAESVMIESEKYKNE